MKRTKDKRPPTMISDYLTLINKVSGKPVTPAKPKPKVIVVKADWRINIP